MLVFVGTVFAVKPAETEWGIQYKMTPRNPNPGDYILLEIYSYSIDLDSSNISYIVNDKLVNAGTGLKTFSYKIPKSSKPFKINIIAKDFYDKVVKKEIVIQPASVDLIYEVVDPYRPIFYKGKSTILSNSKVKFFAFPDFFTPNGGKLSPDTLIYT
jgi:hypothetical protein